MRPVHAAPLELALLVACEEIGSVAEEHALCDVFSEALGHHGAEGGHVRGTREPGRRSRSIEIAAKRDDAFPA